jgi:hypothetical protein
MAGLSLAEANRGKPQHLNVNPESILKASSSAALLAFAFDPRRNVRETPAHYGSKRSDQ